jgi:SAM-dependent methyltransferase
MRVLNLGCGHTKFDFPEANAASVVIGLDISPHSQADVLHDLDEIPWPFESNSFDLVIMQDVIEHVQSVPAAMSEVYRILTDGGRLRIRTPHYSSAYAYGDPTHLHYFGSMAFDHFDADNPNILYSQARFRFLKRKIIFPKLWRVTGVSALANRFPKRWEQLFAFIFRAENLDFELQADKSE